MIHVHTRTELQGLVGQHLGTSDWHLMAQQQIDAFAAATGDRQWIHCDPERAKAESPYGATIAHGFLTLSLCPRLIGEIVKFEPCKLMVNYGLNRVRFPNAVRSGKRIRLGVKLVEAKERDDCVDATCECTIELEGESKPACVAELVLRVYF